MIVVPLIATPSQALKIVLNGQSCDIEVAQKGDNVYLTLTLPTGSVLNGMICRDRVILVREAYLGFIGDLAFIDLQGLDDPTWTGLGTRFILVYLDPTEVPA